MTRVARGVELVLEQRVMACLGGIEIRVDAAELAIDAEHPRVLLDRIDRACVALEADLRAEQAEPSLEHVEVVVERRREVRARTRRLTTADRTLIEYQHVHAVLDERERDAEPCDPCADDADIRVLVLSDLRIEARYAFRHPRRDRRAGIIGDGAITHAA